MSRSLPGKLSLILITSKAQHRYRHTSEQLRRQDFLQPASAKKVRLLQFRRSRRAIPATGATLGMVRPLAAKIAACRHRGYAGARKWTVPMKQILKYPRTLHLRGSTLQQDDDPDQVSMASLKGKGNFVFEEKADGANAGLSFDPGDGDMVLQSRGHSLDGGGRERQFDIFKSWAQTFERDFREALSTRYVAYGEWMAAKHSEFYDNLPHLFLTYDLYDREKNAFLSTPARARVLDGLPIVPIHVVHEGWVPDKEVPKLVRELARRIRLESLRCRRHRGLDRGRVGVSACR
jgi:RNA ligase-like protein